jgi:kumamolisin
MPKQQRVPVPGSERTLPAGAIRTGEVPGDEIVHVTAVLRSSIDAKEASQLDREAYSERAGAAPEAVEAVAAFAREHGLTVVERDRRRRSVVLAGPAQAIAAAFGASLATFQVAEHGISFRGRTGPITLPDDVAPHVIAVLGLDSRPVAKPHVRARAAAGTDGSFTPLDLADLYDFPAGVSGTGETIAIIELGGGYRPADLAAYFKTLGVKAPKVSAVSVGGAVNKPGSAADMEVVLDVEVAGAIAPGANIAVYFAKNTDQGFHDAIAMAVHDQLRKPSIVSISWGGPEDAWTDQARAAMNAALQDAAAMGVTVTVAAGDDGATDGVKDGKRHCDFPASSPFALACGGTTLMASSGTITSEVVWNELASNHGATGGGVSRVFPLPAYQQSAGVGAQPETGFAGRGVPDVSGVADPTTGYQIHINGKDTVVGGTSAVAPLWAGLVARLNQLSATQLGFLNPKLYAFLPSPFRDISSGDNDGYVSRTGWDPCTGLGSPSGQALQQAIAATLAVSAATKAAGAGS